MMQIETLLAFRGTEPTEPASTKRHVDRVSGYPGLHSLDWAPPLFPLLAALGRAGAEQWRREDGLQIMMCGPGTGPTVMVCRLGDRHGGDEGGRNVLRDRLLCRDTHVMLDRARAGVPAAGGHGGHRAAGTAGPPGRRRFYVWAPLRARCHPGNQSRRRDKFLILGTKFKLRLLALALRFEPEARAQVVVHGRVLGPFPHCRHGGQRLAACGVAARLCMIQGPEPDLTPAHPLSPWRAPGPT